MRFAFAGWLLLLVVVSLFPLSFKSTLHTNGSLHDFVHYGAFALTSVFLWLIVERPISRLMNFLAGVAFSFTQEWAENRIYHAGFEWRDVGTDIAGLISGFAVMVLLLSLLKDPNTSKG